MCSGSEDWVCEHSSSLGVADLRLCSCVLDPHCMYVCIRVHRHIHMYLLWLNIYLAPKDEMFYKPFPYISVGQALLTHSGLAAVSSNSVYIPSKGLRGICLPLMSAILGIYHPHCY